MGGKCLIYIGTEGLVRDVNFQGIPEDHIYERFGIPKPNSGDRTVQPAAAGNQASVPLKQEANKDLVSSDIDRFILAQGYVDTVADSALLPGAIDLSALERIVDAAQSFEDLEARLADAYDTIGIDKFRSVLAQAMVLAGLKGRSFT